MKIMRKRELGVTLIEILLVTVVISAILYMSIGYMQQKTQQGRYDRAVAQIQQIINAALAYYLANGAWPPNSVDLKCLQGIGCAVAYLPPGIKNYFTPYQGPTNYFIASTTGQFQVIVPIHSGAHAFADASTLAGMLPGAYALDEVTGNPCIATSSACALYVTVPIPGQNTNNATSVNFASIYHNGACVPTPSCPPTGGTTMQQSIIVAPASVTGAYDAVAPGPNCNKTTQSGCTVNAYPISSFTASATPKATATATDGPSSCKGFLAGTPDSSPCVQAYDPVTGNPIPVTLGQEYWRVCLSVVTEKGIVVPTTDQWGELTGSVMAITRCSISGENGGSGFTVWSQ